MRLNCVCFQFVPGANGLKVRERMIRLQREPMSGAALKRKPALKTFHATLLVTRTEEWCVEAETLEEARALFAAGNGHRCHVGERIHVEVDRVDR
jgi:hypothetical protein